MINKEAGEEIKKARKELNMTQEDLANKLHVSKAAVYNWENGKNGIDKETLDKLEKLLDVNISNKRKLHEFGELDIKPLDQINEMDELMEQVDKILTAVELDEFCKASVGQMLEYALNLALAYEIYYNGIQDQGKGTDDIFGDCPIGWDIIAEDLEWLLDDELYHVPQSFAEKFLMEDGTYMKLKIHHMEFAIGAELFEDFDDEGWRNGYVQQIGRYGRNCGQKLRLVLPGIDNSVITSFKCAILELAELLRTVYSEGNS